MVSTKIIYPQFKKNTVHADTLSSSVMIACYNKTNQVQHLKKNATERNKG